MAWCSVKAQEQLYLYIHLLPLLFLNFCGGTENPIELVALPAGI
jgi:hypothetical protein